MAGPKRKPPRESDKPPKRRRGPKQRADDIFEVEEAQAEEDKIPNKFDRVENYEYELPSDFEDEEIDEELAFTEEDKKKYADMYDNLDNGMPGRDSDDEDAQDDDILWDEGEHNDEDDDGLFGDDDAEEDLMEDGEEDEAVDNEGEAEEKYRATLRAALGDAAEGIERKKRKKTHNIVISEAYPESEFNLNPMAASSGMTKEVTVQDLIAGLGEDRRKLGAARKVLEKLGGSSKPVSAPLPRPVKERQERKAGYQHTSEEAAKWQAMVKSNREVPTLRFTSGREDVPRTVTTAALVAKFKPETDMEAEVAALLAAAGADTSKAVLESEEALAMKALTMEEVKARRERLARMRSLLFYHELKSKRLRAIKSKEFHRKANRMAKRKAAVAAEAGADGALGDQALARKAAEEAEFMRAKERLTLKHKNTSRWARRALKRGLPAMDDGTKEALAEQLRLGQELKRKVMGERRRGSGSDASGSDASTSASDDDGADAEEGTAAEPARAGRATARAKAAALDILAGDDEAGLELPKKGLLSLPFMARALQRRRQEAQEEAKALLVELEVEQRNDAARAAARAAGHDSDTAEVEDVAAGRPRAGRMAFGGGVPAGRDARQRHGDDPEGAAWEAGQSDSDGMEDAEAKAERLRRASGGEAGPSPAGAAGTAATTGGRRARRRTAAAAAAPPTDGGFDPAALMSAPAGEAFAVLAGSWPGVDGEGTAGAAAAARPVAAPTPPPSRAAKAHPASDLAASTASRGGADGGGASSSFIPAKSFAGARPGYAFKKGPQGVGYYTEAAASAQQTKKGGARMAAQLSAGNLPAAKPEQPQANGSGGAPKAQGGGTAPAVDAGVEADVLMKPVGGDAELQRELIRRAFAGDDVEADFAKSKAEDAAGELPSIDEPSALPGWGSWAGAGKEPRWMAAQRARAAKTKEEALARRKDANLKSVVVSEKFDKKSARYMSQQVPYPFDSREVYERSMRQPLGRDFNPDASFRNLTRPAVIKTAGLVIEPIRYSKAMSDSIKDGSVNKELKPRLVNTMGGGLLRRTKGAK